MNSEDSKFGWVQGTRKSETAVYALVHEDFATARQHLKRLETRIQGKRSTMISVRLCILKTHIAMFILLLSIALLSDKTLARCGDLTLSKTAGYRFPVVMRIPPELQGQSVDRFRAWSFDQSRWTQIAIQVDEINSDHSFVLEEGLPYTKYTGNGLGDGLDELSIKGTDIGNTFSMEDVPKDMQERYSLLHKLDVCSQDDRYHGSVLVGIAQKASDGVPAWKRLFNVEQRRVDTNFYSYLFNKDQPMLIGNVFLKSQGREFPVFENSTFVMPLNPGYWFLPRFEFGDQDFSSEIECWRSGPVRSIVAIGARLKKFFSLVNLHLFSELIFYEDYFQIPTQIEMTFDAGRFLSYGSGMAYILRYPKDGSWNVKSTLDRLPADGVLGDSEGKPIKTAKQASPEGVFRTSGSRSVGSFLAQVRVASAAIEQVPPPFLINKEMFDSKAWKASWPWLRGAEGDLGVFLDISQVKKGLYDFALDLMLSPQANDDFTDFNPVQGRWVGLTNSRAKIIGH